MLDDLCWSLCAAHNRSLSMNFAIQKNTESNVIVVVPAEPSVSVVERYDLMIVYTCGQQMLAYSKGANRARERERARKRGAY